MKVIHHKLTHKLNQSKIFLPLTSFTFLTLISALLLSSTFTSASSEVISTSIKVLEACSITSPTSNNTPYEIIGGTYESNIKETTINISCNDPNGYSLYAMGVDSTGTISNTNLTGTVSGETIPTGTSTSTTVSNWAFKLSGVSGTYQPNILSDTNGSFADYHIIPDTNTKVANYTNAINNSTYSTVKATYAVAVTPYQRADTYVGRVKYTLVHPNFADSSSMVSVTLSKGNATNIIVDGHTYSADQTITVDGGTHAISGTIDTTNYHFVNWTGTNVNITDANALETIFTVTGENATISLNAAQNCNSTIAGTMQDFNPCSTIANGATGTLTDTRDSKTYSVAKLADGKYWMTSNLNLAGGTVLSSDKSDVPSANYYTLPVSATKNPDNANLTDDSQFSSDSGEYVFNSNNNTTTCNSSTPCNSYYSWLVATAGGKDTSGNAVTDNGYNTAYSICPKGWRLPTATTEGVSRDNGGYTGGDFYKMILAVTGQSSLANGYYEGTANFYNAAGPGTTPNFLLAGSYSGDSFYYGGSVGNYWSATSRSSTHAYNLNFNSSSVGSANYNARRVGFPVRCLFTE